MHRALALVVVGGIGSASVAAAAGVDGTRVAAFWQARGAPAGIAEPARAAFARAAAARGLRLVELPAEQRVAPSLAPRLADAIAAYRAFRFADVAGALSSLIEAAEAQGGGDLDGRQLSEAFLYRGLARLELGQAEAAWDDFVRAARLDPGRVLDPAQFPPRAVAAFRRAAEDAARLPRAELDVAAPEGATVWLDGTRAVGQPSGSLGVHLLRVEAPGYEPWAGPVTVTAARERIAPSLRAKRPPETEALAARARAEGARSLLLGALSRAGSGWRFAERLVDERGDTTAAESAIDAPSAARVVDEVTQRVLVAPAPIALAPVPAATSERPRRRLWPWLVGAGAVAAALAIVVPIAVVYSAPAQSVGGDVGPLK